MTAEAFVITFREGVEAALLVGVMLAYLTRTSRAALSRWVYLGVAAGVAASLAEAVVIQSLYAGAETAQQSIIAGATMVLASVLVVSLVVWMMRAARGVKEATELRLERSLALGAALGVFLLAFAFIFREGSETVLFLYSLTFVSNPAAQVASGAVGLGFAVAWGALIAKGAVRVDLRRFFQVTSTLIGLFVVEMVASAIHEFQEARVLGPTGAGPLWDLQVWLVTDKARLVTMLPVVVVPLLLLLFSRTREQDSGSAAPQRAKAAVVSVRLGAIALTAVLMLVFAEAAAAQHPAYDPAPEDIALTGGRAFINVAGHNLTDGMLHKFHMLVAGHDLRLLAITGTDGDLRLAFDACKVCGSMGFVQTARDAVACKRCGVETAVDDVGRDIACHPAPVHWSLEGGNVVLDESALAAGAAFFG